MNINMAELARKSGKSEQEIAKTIILLLAMNDTGKVELHYKREEK